MKHIRIALPLVLLALLAACAPSASTPSPAAPEIVYAAPAAEVYPVVVRAISTSQGLPDSNGWIITQSDAVGGFVAAETSVAVRNLLGAEIDTERESISVVVSGSPNNQTAVVTQFTRGAGALASLIHEQLTASFGEPVQGGRLTPTN